MHVALCREKRTPKRTPALQDHGIGAYVLLRARIPLVDRDKTDPSRDGPPTESGPLEVRGLQPVLNPASSRLPRALRLASNETLSSLR